MLFASAARLLSPAFLAAAVLGVSGTPAAAQEFPTKSIRLVIPQATGGGSDTIGRYLAQKLGDSLGQKVVVDNKPGAAGLLGAEIVRQAPPDGYTLLLGAIDTITAPMVSERTPFDGVKDFSPVTQLAESPNVVLKGPGFDGSTLQDVVARAKAQPRQLDYASSGVGSMQHLGGEMLARMAGIELNHVPYKGGPPAFTDVIGGRVPLMVSGIQGALPHIKSGKVTPLAVTGKARSSALPDVPTVSEALGLPDYEAMNWQALLLPAGTPQPIVSRFAIEVSRILSEPDTREKLEVLGYVPIGNTPAEFASVMAMEQKRWSSIIKAANIRSE